MLRLNAHERVQAESAVHETVQDCLQAMYDQGTDSYPLLKEFQPEIRLSWSSKRRYSRGGLSGWKRPFISLGMAAISQANLHPVIGSRFAEYKRINRDSLIGGFISKDWLDYYRCLTIHEMAHAMQGFLYLADSGLREQMAKPHGTGWRSIYGLLRRTVLNRKISEQDGLFPLNWELSFNAARNKAGGPLMVLADQRDVLHLCLTGTGPTGGITLCRGSFQSLRQTSVPDTFPVSKLACPRCLCALLGN